MRRSSSPKSLSPAHGRAQKRLPLPGPPERLVVALGGGQRVADRARPPLRTQAQVDAEDHAVLGHLLDGGGDPARQLDVVLVQRQRPGRARVRRVEVAEVDVRREVQLLAAQLAHGEDDEHRRPVLAFGRPVLAAQLAVAVTIGKLDARVGEARQLARHLLGRPPAELARAETQHLAPAEEAQPAHEVGEVSRPCRRGLGLGQRQRRGLAPRQPRIAEQRRPQRHFGAQQARQEAAAVHDRRQQPPRLAPARRDVAAQLAESLQARRAAGVRPRHPRLAHVRTPRRRPRTCCSCCR